MSGRESHRDGGAGDGWDERSLAALCLPQVSRPFCGFRVLCLDCGEQTPRGVLQERFQVLNPTWSAEAHGLAPDGDVFLTEEEVQSFQVPSCSRCGGPLKPDVVFFGDTVKPDKVDFVHKRVKEADSLLVVGSSLQVTGLLLLVTDCKLGGPGAGGSGGGLVSKSCLILYDPMDCSPPGSSVPGISQANILELVAISSSWGSNPCLLNRLYPGGAPYLVQLFLRLKSSHLPLLP